VCRWNDGSAGEFFVWRPLYHLTRSLGKIVGRKGNRRKEESQERGKPRQDWLNQKIRKERVQTGK
jgi:hypothetical protein